MLKIAALLAAAFCLMLPARASVVLSTSVYNGLGQFAETGGESSVTGGQPGSAYGIFHAIAAVSFDPGTATLESLTSASITQYIAASFQGAEGASVFNAAQSYPAIQEWVTVHGGSGDGKLIYSLAVQGSASASDTTGTHIANTGAWMDVWHGSARQSKFLEASATPYAVTMDLPFTFDTPFLLYLALETYGTVTDYYSTTSGTDWVGGPYDAELHTAFTATWNNTSIVGADGEPVAGAWLNADGPIPMETPEPATLALVWSGMAAGVWRLRTSRRRSTPC